MSEKKHQQFTALQNAMMQDPSLRALKNSNVYIETLRLFNLGLKSYIEIAVVAFLETARKSSAIERVTKLNQFIDQTTITSTVTPNLNSLSGKFKELEFDDK